MSHRLALKSGEASATVSLHGAQWLSWAPASRNLLWKADASVWGETAPILFPVVGWTRGGVVRVGAEVYPLGLHGFARSKTFVLVDSGPAHATLRLEDDAETRAVFPFAFRFDLTYRLTSDALALRFDIMNRGASAMPYACGAHPGFAWPFAGDNAAGYRVVFDEPEEPSVPEITVAGLFSATRRPIPLDGCTLPVEPGLFAREALCFLDARSRGLAFVAPDGSAIRMDLSDMPHVALWSRPGGRFLALEAWTGHGDPDGFTGDLFAKPSMQVLDPGAVARHEVSYRWERAGRGRT